MIYAQKAGRGGGDFSGIDIGAQVMAGDSSQAFGQQDKGGRDLFGLIDPAPDRGLGHPKRIGHRLLRGEVGGHLLQGLIAGRGGFHAPIYTDMHSVAQHKCCVRCYSFPYSP